MHKDVREEIGLVLGLGLLAITLPDHLEMDGGELVPLALFVIDQGSHVVDEPQS